MKTNKIIITLILSVFFSTLVTAQEVVPEKSEPVIYAVAVNIVPDGFNAPLIGFVNIGKGHHKSTQLGFVNINAKSFKGFQAAYINTAGGPVKGAQAGFINTCAGGLQGVQYGFVNTSAGNTEGAQIGFVNTTSKQLKGAQIGFVNTSADSAQGAQLGYVNTASKRIEGTQIGFVNGTGSLKGTQLGFINYADSLESGVPVGFFSFVRKGGFQAVEVGYNTTYPYNISFKTGVRKFYTSFILGFNPQTDHNFASGFGIGSIVPMSKGFFFNPELNTMSAIGRHYEQSSTLTPSFGYAVTPHLHLVAGPTLNWTYSINDDEWEHPNGKVFVHSINTNNKMIVGFRAGLRLALSNILLK